MLKLEEAGLSPEALAAGIEYLSTRAKDGFICNADFSMIKADGTRRDCNNQACHGSMGGESYELIATVSCWATYRYLSYVVAYAKAPYDKVLATETGERFYDWLCNESWAAEYIVAPDLGFAMYNGFMFSTDIPANYALAIATMSRNAQEQAHNVQRMFDYVDEFGVSRDLAYFLAFGCATENKYGQIIGGHNLFNQQGAKAVDNWMNRRIQKTNDSMRSGGYNTGVNAMWGDREDVVKSFEPFKNKVEAGKVVIPNPFKPVVNKSGVMTEEFLRDIIPNLRDHYDIQEEKKVAA